MDRATADYMGMLATVMNSLALADTMRQEGMTARVMSAISIEQVVEPYVRPKALQYLEGARSWCLPPAPAIRSSPQIRRRRCVGRDRRHGAQATKVDGVLRRPEEGRVGNALFNVDFRRGHRQEPAGDGCHRVCAVPRPETSDQVFSIVKPGALRRVVLRRG